MGRREELLLQVGDVENGSLQQELNLGGGRGTFNTLSEVGSLSCWDGEW